MSQATKQPTITIRHQPIEMHAVSRRSIIAALAAVPVAAIPAAALAALPDDPIFAAIERHRVAYAELESFPDCSAPVCSAEHDARDEAFGVARDAVDDVAWTILDAEPTTIAGVAALLAYLNDHSQGGYAEFPAREEGEFVITFEEDTLALAVKVLRRLSGGANG